MKIHYYMAPRQSGKSTIADFINYDNKDSFYLVIQSCKNIRANTYTYSNFKYAMVGRRIKTLILDEYHFISMKDKEWLYDNIGILHDLEDLYIFTTPKFQYSKEIIDLVIDCKMNGLSLSDTCYVIDRDIKLSMPFMSEEALRESVAFLYYDFYTMPEHEGLEIIKDDALYFTNKNICCRPNFSFFSDAEKTGKFFH